MLVHAVLAEFLAMIGRKNDDRLIQSNPRFDGLDQFTNQVVNETDFAVVKI